jgi:hypothetical protein
VELPVNTLTSRSKKDAIAIYQEQQNGNVLVWVDRISTEMQESFGCPQIRRPTKPFSKRRLIGKCSWL